MTDSNDEAPRKGNAHLTTAKSRWSIGYHFPKEKKMYHVEIVLHRN